MPGTVFCFRNTSDFFAVYVQQQQALDFSPTPSQRRLVLRTPSPSPCFLAGPLNSKDQFELLEILTVATKGRRAFSVRHKPCMRKTLFFDVEGLSRALPAAFFVLFFLRHRGLNKTLARAHVLTYFTRS